MAINKKDPKHIDYQLRVVMSKFAITRDDSWGKKSSCEVENSILHHIQACGNPKVRNYHTNLYTEHYKTLLKEYEQDINKWRNVSCLRTKKLDFVKMSDFLNLIYRLCAIPIQNLISFFIFFINFLSVEINKPILVLYGKGKVQKQPKYS